MKILVAYFSATKNTEKIANKIGKALTGAGVEVLTRDITSYKDRQNQIDMDSFDAVMFGFPIYVNRAPVSIREWLATLDGKGKKCSTFFTYGGIKSHPAHRSTREILEGSHFVLVSSAEFLGEHTLNRAGWEAVEDRPEHSDFEFAIDYALKTLKRFAGEDLGELGELPEGQPYKVLDQMELGMKMVIKQKPSRMGAECSMCMDCEELCATSAMDAKRGKADKDKCIHCLRCVDICPESVIKIGDLSPMFKMALDTTQQTKESLAEKKSRAYF